MSQIISIFKLEILFTFAISFFSSLFMFLLSLPFYSFLFSSLFSSSLSSSIFICFIFYFLFYFLFILYFSFLNLFCFILVSSPVFFSQVFSLHQYVISFPSSFIFQLITIFTSNITYKILRPLCCTK